MNKKVKKKRNYKQENKKTAMFTFAYIIMENKSQ
jgi:hypothetical protein